MNAIDELTKKCAPDPKTGKRPDLVTIDPELDYAVCLQLLLEELQFKRNAKYMPVADLSFKTPETLHGGHWLGVPIEVRRPETQPEPVKECVNCKWWRSRESEFDYADCNNPHTPTIAAVNWIFPGWYCCLWEAK